MNAVEGARRFCGKLDQHRVRYHIDIIRDNAVMIGLAVPGQRWEVEFLEDGTVEVERFETTGVVGCDDPLALVLAYYE